MITFMINMCLVQQKKTMDKVVMKLKLKAIVMVTTRMIYHKLPISVRERGRRCGFIYFMTCSGHRYHIGGGKPTPPTVTLVKHSGALASTEREAPPH